MDSSEKKDVLRRAAWLRRACRGLGFSAVGCDCPDTDSPFPGAAPRCAGCGVPMVRHPGAWRCVSVLSPAPSLSAGGGGTG